MNKYASSLWNFCRLSFLEFEECLNRISDIEIFSISSYIKNYSKKFTDHLNAIWYRLQVTEATNGFTFQIINSWMKLESWPRLTVTPPLETWELFWAIFAFSTLFSSWNMVLPPNFFSLLSAQNEVNELLPANSSVSIKHGLRTADYGLRTGYKLRTRYKTRTRKYGLGIKHGQGIKCRLRTADWV